MNYLSLTDESFRLPTLENGLPRFHQFDSRSVAAINAALAAGRPLLVRGEPGVGKTQLAEAAAEKLNRAFLRQVADARTESRDLLYQFDAVMRLAEAQLCGAQRAEPEAARQRLELLRFLVPGPLWWAFDPVGAASHVCEHEVRMNSSPLELGQNRKRSGNGWVVLIDEIDKAETDVPNGLLEALGSGGFTPLGCQQRVEISDPPPLVMIATNEERTLPDAFVRRCVVLHLALPKEDAKLRAWLVGRGRTHFEEANQEVLEEAAKIVVRDRKTADEQSLKPLPGQAEYLDLLRAVIRQRKDSAEQLELLETVANYVVKKPVEMQEQQKDNR